MPIEEKPLKHWIENFYGYGSWDSKIWFVGYEEGGGDLPEEVGEKLNYFYSLPKTNSPTLCDIREMYRYLEFRAEGPQSDFFTNFFEYRFGRNAVLHGFWKNLIAFVHGYKDKKLPNLLTYQKNSFTTKAEALIQLYPLPSPHNHAWYYSWLDLPNFGFLKRRKSYEESVFQSRMNGGYWQRWASEAAASKSPLATPMLCAPVNHRECTELEVPALKALGTKSRPLTAETQRRGVLCTKK